RILRLWNSGIRIAASAGQAIRIGITPIRYALSRILPSIVTNSAPIIDLCVGIYKGMATHLFIFSQLFLCVPGGLWHFRTAGAIMAYEPARGKGGSRCTNFRSHKAF